MMTTAEAAAAAIAGILGIALISWVLWHGLRVAIGIFRSSSSHTNTNGSARPETSDARQSALASAADYTPLPGSPARSWRGPTCEVCGERASEPWPVVKRARLDRDWFGHRSLHASAPMYVVDEKRTGAPAQLCKPHQRLVRGMLDHALAQIRAKHAEHNAEIERQLARLEMGELLARAQVEGSVARDMIDAVRAQDPSPRQLPPASVHPGTVTLMPTEDQNEHDENADTDTDNGGDHT